VHYGACTCGAADRFLVLRTSAVQQGLDMLRGLTLADVRSRCTVAPRSNR
jgi:hypothetical protein